jgi:Fe-S cluster assembly iron-binding protein IscA
MVNVTERARAKLKKLLRSKSADESLGLRLGTMTSGALGVFPDRERADDQVVEHEGARVLLVGTDLAAKVEGGTIDCDEGGGPGPGLVIKRTAA